MSEEESKANLCNDSPFSWQKLIKGQEDSLIIDEDEEGEDAAPTPNARTIRNKADFCLKPIKTKVVVTNKDSRSMSKIENSAFNLSEEDDEKIQSYESSSMSPHRGIKDISFMEENDENCFAQKVINSSSPKKLFHKFNTYVPSKFNSAYLLPSGGNQK